MKTNFKHGFSIMELIITTLIMAIICIVAPIIILKRAPQGKNQTKASNIILRCITPIKVNGEEKEVKYCIYDSIRYIKYMYNKNGELVNSMEVYDTKRNKQDFYDIYLIGGGAGATDNSVGSSGQLKQVGLIGLERNTQKDVNQIKNELNGTSVTSGDIGLSTGFFFMEIGAGGAKNKAGGDTRFCVTGIEAAENNNIKNFIDNNEACLIEIARASGGIISNEVNKNCENSYRKTNSYGESESASDTDNQNEIGFAGNGGGCNECESGSTTCESRFNNTTYAKGQAGAIVIK